MNLSLAQIARWSAAEIPASTPADSIRASGYSIDSRTLQPGELFFAIHGERFDGHDFVASALERGACAAVVARKRLPALPNAARQGPLLVAVDPLAALQHLASAVRRHWGKRVVAITGSAGKTTTKEAVAAVLATRFRVLKSQGNLNNHYGLPLQLLRLQPEHEVAVIEMGMSAAGEIAALCRIASPDWGVVTNVGNAHAENFADGIAGIARAKYELIASLPAHGAAFLNCDDPYVGQFGRDFVGKVVYFGRGPCADPRAVQVESLGTGGVRAVIRAGSENCPLQLGLLGEHNVANALAAIAVGMEAGIPLNSCCAALAELEPGDKRGQMLLIRGATVINDSYNSNPAALNSMIAALRQVPASRRILVAGEMLELGPNAPALHAASGKAAAQAGINVVLGVRGLACHLVQSARQGGAEALFLETPQQAGAWLAEHLRPGDAVLLKASRGVRLERALEALTSAEKDDGPAPPAV
ncbi:MAG TPA: UDP-N-acetylmuramoyl-tripeptide--D-alanyl-D-alanine ligase [Acidobacteriaceae bacterium]|jgi:UDP-N-acetylmuramoyl-tripeptide--D-alanyl-D-alanine ligase|nr:UDP-N-acetylmuramoyl-tripeptide--D-alanyl-D-alanine ligase [Acidobacteriaceae bacterium]